MYVSAQPGSLKSNTALAIAVRARAAPAVLLAGGVAGALVAGQVLDERLARGGPVGTQLGQQLGGDGLTVWADGVRRTAGTHYLVQRDADGAYVVWLPDAAAGTAYVISGPGGEPAPP